jgi:hypothetical protein
MTTTSTNDADLIYDEIDPGWTYHFHRSDVPLLLFALSPIFGLILDAPLWWWLIMPLFWGNLALLMGYSIGSRS